MDPNARVGQASPLPILKASTSNVEDAGVAQPNLSDSWSTMGSWRPGSRSSPGSSGFSHGLSDSGFLDTPRPRSARGLEPTPEEESAQSLADSGFLQARPSPDALPRPAARSSLLPTMKEANGPNGTLRGTVMSTITGSLIAALSVLPLVVKPHFPSEPTQENDPAVHLADALASICTTGDERAHAIVVADDGEIITLYHAEDTLPNDTQDAAARSKRAEERRQLRDHLGSVHNCLRDLYDHQSSVASSATIKAELVKLVYSRSLRTLRTRFEHDVDTVLSGLSKIVHRSFAHADILRHPQPWRFNCVISETEWELLKGTHETLSSVKAFFTRFTVDCRDPDALSALHLNLLVLYLAWFDPETRRNNESESYFLNHLDRILQFSFAQYLRTIVWLAQATYHLVSAVATPTLSSLFTKPAKVFFVDNQMQPFLANLDHDEIADRISCLYLGDCFTLDIVEKRKRDWSSFVLEPLQPQFNADHSIWTYAHTHCECTLLAYIDRNQPRGLIRHVGLSRDSCLACWEQFSAYNAFMRNLPRVVDGNPVKDSFFSPWRPIHTRATDTRVRFPWVAPDMPSDRRGMVSLYMQTTLLSDLDVAYNRKRYSSRQRPAAGEENPEGDSDLDLNDLFPFGEEDAPVFTRA